MNKLISFKPNQYHIPDTVSKKIVLFSLIFTFFSCNNNEDSVDALNNVEVVKLENNNFVVQKEKDIISKIENTPIAKRLKIKITDLYIDVSRAVGDENIEITQLIASNNDGSIKIGYLLEQKNGSFYINETASTLVCTGCRRGCSSRREPNGDGYCTACSGNYKTCTKTESEMQRTLELEDDFSKSKIELKDSLVPPPPPKLN